MYPIRTWAAAALALSTLTAATPAAAAILFDMARISSDADSYLQIAEVVVDDNGTDVALASNGAVATAVSQLTPNNGPGKAIDGLFGGTISDVYHSLSGGSNEFLTIAFPGPTTAQKISIWARTDCCRARNLYSYEFFLGQQLVAVGHINAITGYGEDAIVPRIPPGPSVPEPATWAMLVAGFGVLGTAMRRRRQVLGAMC